MTRRALLSILLAATMLSGCALSPEPLAPGAIQGYGADKLARLTANQEPIVGPIGLDEAIARGLKYNLDFRVETFQTALRIQDLHVDDFRLLPNLVAQSNYLGRNNDLAAFSQSVTTGQQTLEPSISTPRNDLVSDLTLSYNTLDFGLSYVRAKQAADEVLIAAEGRRKVVNRIVQDIRTAYWRAYSSQRLSSRLHALEARVRRAIDDSHSIQNGLDSSPVAALTYERELVEIKRQAQAIESDMCVAKAQLAALMNVEPNTPFVLSGQVGATRTSRFDEPLDQLVAVAIMNRPELREAQYKSRINSREALAALLELLPSAQAYLGANNDTSNFLFHANWLAYGARTSFNLINVFRYPARVDQIDAQERLLDSRALALTMAIITQIQVSRVRLFEAERELNIAREFLDVQGRLLHQIKAEAATDKTSEQSLIREEMNMLVAESRKDIAFALYENAYGLVYEAVGLDPYNDHIDERSSVRDIATVLNSNWIDGAQRLRLAAKPMAPQQVAMQTPAVRPPAVQKAATRVPSPTTPTQKAASVPSAMPKAAAQKAAPLPTAPPVVSPRLAVQAPAWPLKLAAQ